MDPITHLTFSKSERVETLERIAAQVDEVNKDMSGSVPDFTMERDKTLPAPPIPSQKGLLAPDPPVPLADIFSPSADEDADVAPPTPTLNAFVPPKASRAPLGQLGGLDALEARLLAEVGTRKVEQNSSRPDIRSVLPITIPKPDSSIDPNIDSAISSLSLPGLGADERTERLGKGSYSAEITERGRPRVRDVEGDASNEEPAPKSEPENKVRKKKSEQKAQSEVVKEKEIQRLRKAAQGRVAAWLGNIDSEASPQPGIPPPAESPLEHSRDRVSSFPLRSEPPDPRSTQWRTPPEERPGPYRSQKVGTDAPAHSSEVSLATAEQRAGEDKPAEDEPNPRSSGFMPIRREDLPSASAEQKPGQAARKASKFVWPQRQLDPEVRYDVRSARGGRGGKVTAVAALWAQATNQKPAVPAPKSPPLPPKRLAQWSKTPLSPSPLSQSPESTSDGKSRTTPSSPAAELAARRAKLAKSSSVPAVLSSSLAIPMLSSTASLARPSPRVSPKLTTLPPTILETPEVHNTVDTKVPAKRELAFGQARLRELIKKYQG